MALVILVCVNIAAISSAFTGRSALPRTAFRTFGVAPPDVAGNDKTTATISSLGYGSSDDTRSYTTTETVTTITGDDRTHNYRDLWRSATPDAASQAVLERRQTEAHAIASSFAADAYDPAPFARNGHVQTIAGALLRDRPRCAYWTTPTTNWMTSFLLLLLRNNGDTNDSGTGLDYWDDRERVDTPDGDFFHVDHKYVSAATAGEISRGTVVVVHGFESDSSSPLCLDMARAFVAKGFDVSCVNFRGCSGEKNIQPGAYHLGFTDDLKLLMGMIKSRNDDAMVKKPIYLSGFSLGANASLKMLGELGVVAQNEYNIRGAAVTSVPFDLIKSGGMLNTPGINKSIYTEMFLKSVKAKTVEKYEANYLESIKTSSPFPFDYEGVMAATKISDIEDAYVAPIFGFNDHMDYYAKVMSGSYVGGIAVPVLAINAQDDPFFHPDMTAPTVTPNPLRFQHPKYGGHCGYMFHQDKTLTDDNVPSTSWMPSELARFIDHVDNNTPR